MARFPQERQSLFFPSLSFIRFSRIRKACQLDSDFNAPSLSAICCFCGLIRLLCSREINEEIAMVPGAGITKSGCSWDDDFTHSFSLKLSVEWEHCQPEDQYIHAVPFEKLADIGVDCMVVWHARQSSNK